MEDMYKYLLQKYATFVMDMLVSIVHFAMTYQNRSLKKWRAIFEDLDLEIIAEKEKRVLLFFRKVTFVLRTNNS